MYILAGKKKLQKTRDEELSALVQKAQLSGLPEDAQKAKDLESLCDRFEKKIHDLELTRMISIQTAPQIRLVQSSDTMMVEKIQSTVVNTIPLWKSQMVLALGVNHAEQAAKAQREVTDMTNELLRKNAAVLKTAAVESAKESERGIVDMETLKNTNASLISTLDEVMKIQAEGRERRRNAEVEMQYMEEELKQKLLEMSGRKAQSGYSQGRNKIVFYKIIFALAVLPFLKILCLLRTIFLFLQQPINYIVNLNTFIIIFRVSGPGNDLFGISISDLQ